MRQTPLKQLGVAARQQKAWSGKGRGSGDQRLQIVIRLGHSMTEEGDLGGVAGDPPVALDYGSRALVYRITQIPAALMAVHRMAEKVARRGIGSRRRSHDTAGDTHPDRRS